MNGRAGPGGPESLGRTRAVALSKHPDEDRSERPILLAVDQKLGEVLV